VEKPNPSVVQLLRLPSVAKMEATETRAMRTRCHGGSAEIWSRRARAWCIRRDGTRASMLRAPGAGVGSSIWTNAASRARMGVGRALGVGLGVCWARAQEQCPDKRRIRTSGR
jgi:hypothetical protein